jgi:hypothetical protein
MAKVTVYHFKCFSITERDYASCFPKMATLERISNIRQGCKPIMETALEIDESNLDGNGFYISPELVKI